MSGSTKVHAPIQRTNSENVDMVDAARRRRPKLKRSLSANVRLSIEEKRKQVCIGVSCKNLEFTDVQFVVVYCFYGIFTYFTLGDIYSCIYFCENIHILFFFIQI